VRTAKTFRARIVSLCKGHGIDDIESAQTKTTLRLSKGDGWDDLLIEKIDVNQVAVSHIHHPTSEHTMYDPRIVFYTGFGKDGWLPMSYANSGLNVHHVYAWLGENGNVAKVNLGMVADLCSFCQVWQKNILHQHWAKAKVITLDIPGVTEGAGTGKVRIESITVQWKEGYTKDMENFPMTFTTWEAFNARMSEWAHETPEGGCYDKTKVLFKWQDGETFQERIDLTREHITRTASAEIKRTCLFYGGKYCPAHMTRKTYENLLYKEGWHRPDMIEFLEAHDLGPIVEE
jgi:hypothetical protein